MAGSFQKLLDALPMSGGCLTVEELSDRTGIRRNKVSDYCCRLRTAGLVTRPRTGCYKLTEAGIEARDAGKAVTSGPNGPHTGRRKPVQGTMRQKIWTALRIKRKATVPDLLAIMGFSDPGKAANNVHQYLRRLRLGGYVTITPVKEPGTHPYSPGFNRYFLVKDTGPEAPVYSHKKGKEEHLFDPNTGEEVILATQPGGPQ